MTTTLYPGVQLHHLTVCPGLDIHAIIGEALPCDHCIAEEAPDALLERVLPFLIDGQ